MNPKLYFLLILLFKFQPNQAQNQPSFSQETLLGQSLPNLYSASIPLLPEVGKAFEEMQKEARKAGIELEIVSAYRSYERQQRIWNRKYTSNAKQAESSSRCMDTPDRTTRSTCLANTPMPKKNYPWVKGCKASLS